MTGEESTTYHTIEVQTYRRVSMEDQGRGLGSFTTVQDKLVKVRVLVEVDLGGLARTLGRKAYFSKGKRAREVGGLVQVTAVHVISEREVKS